MKDLFGYSVSIYGDTAIVGAQKNDDDGQSSGSAYIFTRRNRRWSETEKLASDASAVDEFGLSVAITDDVAIVGAFADDDDGLNRDQPIFELSNDGV